MEKDMTSLLDRGNRILVILIFALLGYAALKYFSDDQNLVQIKNSQKKSIENLYSELETFEEKTFEAYAERLKERDLFESLTDRLKKDMPALEKALPALHKQIKLIGILVDEDSKAIVEDLTERQTHFLSKGESIGMAFLEDIQEGKAIFLYDNKYIEMAP